METTLTERINQLKEKLEECEYGGRLKRQLALTVKPLDDERFYTYLWLREDGTPYYVGKGTNGRAYMTAGHSVRCPKDKSRILVEYFLNEADAYRAEMFLVAYYGRKDLGTGCLCNRTDGGNKHWTRRLLSTRWDHDTAQRFLERCDPDTPFRELIKSLKGRFDLTAVEAEDTLAAFLSDDDFSGRDLSRMSRGERYRRFAGITNLTESGVYVAS